MRERRASHGDSTKERARTTRPRSLAIAGVGAMGGAMAECLLRKGFRVVCVTSFPSASTRWCSASGARRRAPPRPRAGRIVMTVVVDSDETDAVLFGEGAIVECAATAAARRDRRHVQYRRAGVRRGAGRRLAERASR
jgi:hypothetical protein